MPQKFTSLFSLLHLFYNSVCPPPTPPCKERCCISATLFISHVCEEKDEIDILQPLPSIQVKNLLYMDSDNFYLDKVWVQCENSSCLKWRLLSNDDRAQVDLNAPWYCYMNTDPSFNKCSVSEEDFPEESQFLKHGLKYVYSKLPLGSLVLVKMWTWPRWPAIICPDPLNGHHVTYDSDGDVESHHVEFLGKPHSRDWSTIKYIDHYPRPFKPDRCKRRKAWYASALEEADKLLACSTQQRLEMCYLSKKGSIKNKEAETKDDRTWTKTIKAWAKTHGKKSTCRTGRKRKKKTLMCSLETADLEDILSTENLVFSKTEIILKDLDQVLKHVAAPFKPSFESFVNGEDNNVRGEVANCCMEFPEKRPVEISTQEDSIIIDGKAFKARECIESITDRFKEIDSLMAEFQDSL
ncbi:zinc finger CW-type PWWP domain protein 2 isoform X3 [Hemicordylus capensis]|uniref:zinc finger CW-type PWWP domain protein 2 isoform X3 n=1 Tax=Hemicordylus capensis TaxID=884348 RepID=UPI002303AB5F|nr:zinc finger CW-type PWWP domain protein 2 isoform X3 [Hemicordylus capensis]